MCPKCPVVLYQPCLRLDKLKKYDVLETDGNWERLYVNLKRCKRKRFNCYCIKKQIEPCFWAVLYFTVMESSRFSPLRTNIEMSFSDSEFKVTRFWILENFLVWPFFTKAVGRTQYNLFQSALVLVGPGSLLRFRTIITSYYCKFCHLYVWEYSPKLLILGFLNLHIITKCVFGLSVVIMSHSVSNYLDCHCFFLQIIAIYTVSEM